MTAIEALRLILPMAKGYAHAHPVGSNAAYIEAAEAVLAAPAQAEPVAGWISVDDRMPEAETTCLVYSKHAWEKTPSIKIDKWSEQHECPVPFSSVSVPIGLGWDDHDDYWEVSHWHPLPSPPTNGEGA